ncbi:DNA helicase/exodeoxyribonuclease V alpha subunit [Jatrophihabitans sp. GAS493]|uniref:exodeoxyribonuclease V subunit alpha n=1 Tax=Jatrophihabitans sp. GAS493 TaxID=1907575 RepID=UPI000BB9B42F|nr:exodeoxyribonuclease V subunit alpha [Jatrophihabitans sp. GAS493]SOD73498.1 DNA helicase/exodeoxyribonuclease V alpha subunit [Jatrophihabitans sp. GAS493]
MTNVIATRGRGLLKTFNEAGVLTAADVHVASRLGALAREADDRVLLAIALVVRGTRHGSVVLDLADAAQTIVADADQEEVEPAPHLDWPALDEWVAACTTSPLVTGTAGGPPLQMVASRLWLDRYWRQEAQVADDLLRRSADRPSDLDLAVLRQDLSSLFAEADEPDQRLAAAVAALSRVSVIGGGPGTGKTTTVARLITVLSRQLGPGLRVALAAPTGKAAARLEEAVHSAEGPLTAEDRASLARLSASTLHRLLGWRPGVSSRFRHDHENRLPYDVVVVDESSMVSLTLMARLLEALAPATRLVLVGDPDQLASVEAGAVLGDLVDQDDVGPATASFRTSLAQATDGVPADVRAEAPGAMLRESVALLRTVHRFDAGGPIAQLAEHVRAGRADDALALLRAQPPGLAFFETAEDEAITSTALAAVVDRVVAYESAVIDAARAGDVTQALDALERHRLLCAHRAGPRGVRWWTDLIERRLALDLRVTPRPDGRYAGQPLLVTSNDYETGLYNGDTGVVIREGDELAAAFRRGGEPIVLPLARLSDVRPLHAMTVHRGQGSQFDVVTVLLPLALSPLATRQTLYTAITRAADEVRLVGSADSVLACVQRQAARATGLRDRLAGPLTPVATTRSREQT